MMRSLKSMTRQLWARIGTIWAAVQAGYLWRRAVLVATIVSGALVVSAPPPALAAGPTYVSGDISSNTTWTLANSPYVVTANLTVKQVATLTIDPGVVVRFKKSATSSPLSIRMQGTLVAVGTPAQRITFTSDLDPLAGGSGVPSRGDWSDINFSTLVGGWSDAVQSVDAQVC